MAKAQTKIDAEQGTQILLVVDDRAENLEAMQALLDDGDWQLRCVNSGEQALLCLLEEDVGLVLLDVQMPRMDGFEVARLMRGNPRTRFTPIIFVSAIAQREGRGETIEFRFVGIDKAEITDAALKGSTEQVTVRFSSKLISATHDKSGAVIDGDPVHVGDVTDIWTFARDINSRDPNWKLVATESVD